MKTFTTLLMVMALAFCMFSTPALAEDVVLQTEIQSATQALDKNGNTYVRMIINENRSLNGHTYSTGVAVMAFGANVIKAKSMKAGDQLNCIADGRDYKGRKSYTVISFL